MPHALLQIENGVTALICGVPRRKGNSRCCYCGDDSYFLCDFPVGKTKAGKKVTCDRNLCAACSRSGISENVDFCKEHYSRARAAYERRQKKAPTEFL